MSLKAANITGMPHMHTHTERNSQPRTRGHTKDTSYNIRLTQPYNINIKPVLIATYLPVPTVGYIHVPMCAQHHCNHFVCFLGNDWPCFGSGYNITNQLYICTHDVMEAHCYVNNSRLGRLSSSNVAGNKQWLLQDVLAVREFVETQLFVYSW